MVGGACIFGAEFNLYSTLGASTCILSLFCPIVQFCPSELAELASPPEPPAFPRFRVVLLSLDLRVLRSFFEQARAGAVSRSRMGVLIQTLERLPSNSAGRGASFTRKTKPWRPRTQSPRRVKTDDRSDVRQKYVRFYKGPNRFRAFGEADGRQPSYLRLSLESLPFEPYVFVVARGDAAAFRRARFGLSSSEGQYAIIPNLCQGISEKYFFHERQPVYRDSAFSVCEKDDTRAAYSNERWGRPCLSLRAPPRALRAGGRAALRARGASQAAARASVPRHRPGRRGQKSRDNGRARARS